MSFKICVYSRVWESGSGGLKSTREFVKSLREKGHEVKVINNIKSFYKIITNNPIDVVIHQNVKDLPVIARICRRQNIPLIATVNSYITCATSMHITMDGDFGKDCLYCQFPKMVRCLWSGIKYGNPTFSLKSRDATLALGYYLNVKLRINSLNIADKIIVPSPTMKKIFSLSGVHLNKMYVIPQPIGDEFFNTNYKTLNLERPYLLLLSTHWHKGAHIAAKAFNIIKQKFKDVKLVVAGGKTKCLDYMRTILKDNFEYVGWVSGNKLLELYFNSYAVLFPSIWYEAYGRVWAEACAAGKPVIAFKGRGGASDYLVHEKTGLLSDYSIEAYAEEIMKLFENEKLYKKISRNAKRFAKIKFSERIVAEQYTEVIGKCIQEK